MNGAEAQIVQGLLGLLTAGVTAAVGYFTPKLKKIADAHLNTTQANQANAIITGLGNIAQSVVSDFNQKVVNDLKSNGLFTAQAAADVKADAIAAVKSQGASLIQLGQGVLGDVDGLVSSLIEQAVVAAKPASSAPIVAPVTDSAKTA